MIRKSSRLGDYQMSRRVPCFQMGGLPGKEVDELFESALARCVSYLGLLRLKVPLFWRIESITLSQRASVQEGQIDS
jgi:hypothetical protein